MHITYFTCDINITFGEKTLWQILIKYLTWDEMNDGICWNTEWSVATNRFYDGTHIRISSKMNKKWSRMTHAMRYCVYGTKFGFHWIWRQLCYLVNEIDFDSIIEIRFNFVSLGDETGPLKLYVPRENGINLNDSLSSHRIDLLRNKTPLDMHFGANSHLIFFTHQYISKFSLSILHFIILLHLLGLRNSCVNWYFSSICFFVCRSFWPKKKLGHVPLPRILYLTIFRSIDCWILNIRP